MWFLKKQLASEMNMDTTTVRQLFKMFSDQNLAVVGFVAVHKCGSVGLSLLDHVDDDTAAHIMAGLIINCERAIREAAERHGNPSLN